MQYVVVILFIIFFSIPILLSIKNKTTKVKYKYKPYNDITEEESKFLKMLNNQRKSIGTQYLFVDDVASFVCYIHSMHMAQNGKSHDNYPERQRVLLEDGAYSVGEIVNSHNNINGLFESFMQSDEHRQTMLDNKYDTCGISIVKNNFNTMYCTVIFLKTIQ